MNICMSCAVWYECICSLCRCMYYPSMYMCLCICLYLQLVYLDSSIALVQVANPICTQSRKEKEEKKWKFVRLPLCLMTIVDLLTHHVGSPDETPLSVETRSEIQTCILLISHHTFVLSFYIILFDLLPYHSRIDRELRINSERVWVYDNSIGEYINHSILSGVVN